MTVAQYMATEQAARTDKERRIDAVIRALNEHDEKYGVWGEEYSEI